MSHAATIARDPQRKPAIACGCLLAAVVVLVALGRHDPAPAFIDPANVRQTMELRFGDLPDGAVVVSDAGTGAEIERIAPGAGGFIRVTMRSFANQRKQDGMGSETPFILTRMKNGNLYLQDSLTGRTMLLNAFGPSNEGVFAALIDHERTTQ